jgi:PAS domain-containing protein
MVRTPRSPFGERGVVDLIGVSGYYTAVSMTLNVAHVIPPGTKGDLMEDLSLLAEKILEQIADAVIYADYSGTIKRWNRASAALFGYSAAAIKCIGSCH